VRSFGSWTPTAAEPGHGVRLGGHTGELSGPLRGGCTRKPAARTEAASRAGVTGPDPSSAGDGTGWGSGHARVRLRAWNMVSISVAGWSLGDLPGTWWQSLRVSPPGRLRARLRGWVGEPGRPGGGSRRRPAHAAGQMLVASDLGAARVSTGTGLAVAGGRRQAQSAGPWRCRSLPARWRVAGSPWPAITARIWPCQASAEDRASFSWCGYRDPPEAASEPPGTRASRVGGATSCRAVRATMTRFLALWRCGEPVPGRRRATPRKVLSVIGRITETGHRAHRDASRGLAAVAVR